MGNLCIETTNYVKTQTGVNATGEKVVVLQVFVKGVPGSWIEYNATQLRHLIGLLEQGHKEISHQSTA